MPWPGLSEHGAAVHEAGDAPRAKQTLSTNSRGGGFCQVISRSPTDAPSFVTRMNAENARSLSGSTVVHSATTISKTPSSNGSLCASALLKLAVASGALAGNVRGVDAEAGTPGRHGSTRPFRSSRVVGSIRYRWQDPHNEGPPAGASRRRTQQAAFPAHRTPQRLPVKVPVPFSLPSRSHTRSCSPTCADDATAIVFGQMAGCNSPAGPHVQDLPGSSYSAHSCHVCPASRVIST